MGLSKAGNSSANLSFKTNFVYTSIKLNLLKYHLLEIDLKILLLFSKLLLIIFDLIDFPSLASLLRN